MKSASLDETTFKNIDLIAKSPYEFIRQCVFTRDEVDSSNPVKPAPSDLAYIKVFCHMFMRERLIAVPKSRRMWVTWLVLACFLWDTVFNRVRANFIQSKKEDDADALLDRVEFMLEQIPVAVIPKKILPKWRRKFCHLEFAETGSYIKAIPQGADQLRQYTASGIFMDEFAFWDDAEATYGASVPTIQGGGRIVIVSTPPDNSSPQGSFFERLVYDRL